MTHHRLISQQIGQLFFSDIYSDIWNVLEDQASQHLSDTVWDKCFNHIPVREIGWSIDEQLLAKPL